jgi:uncharacterized repeat protein (TIGR03987 family)
MPVNILIAIFSIFAALVFYSIGALGAFRAGIMRTRNLIMIWTGFVFDVLATIIMTIQAGGLLADFHTVLGLVGLFGMFAVALLSTLAIRNLREEMLKIIARWVLAPWSIWVISFIWGMVVRGAARMMH